MFTRVFKIIPMSLAMLTLVQGYPVSDPNCGKKGYHQVRDHINQDPKPNCYEGMWLECRNCTREHRCQTGPCTPESDADCGPVVEDLSVCSSIYEDPHCWENGYHYVRDHINQPPEPSCYKGTWMPCTNCESKNRCQTRPCTPTSDTECGPEVSDVKTCPGKDRPPISTPPHPTGDETDNTLGPSKRDEAVNIPLRQQPLEEHTFFRIFYVLACMTIIIFVFVFCGRSCRCTRLCTSFNP